MTVQNLILSLHQFWSQHDCIMGQPSELEQGAGTFTPATGKLTITETARVGQTLTAAKGTIADTDGVPTSLSLQV